MSDATPEPEAPREVTPAPPGITRSKLKYRPLSHSRTPRNWKVIGLSVAVAVAAGLVVLVVMNREVELELEAKGQLDRTVTLGPGQHLTYILVCRFNGPYEFDLSAHEGDVMMALGRIENRDTLSLLPREVESVLREAVNVAAGRRHILKGDLQPGRYLWTVVNLSSEKAVDVTIKFKS